MIWKYLSEKKGCWPPAKCEGINAKCRCALIKGLSSFQYQTLDSVTVESWFQCLNINVVFLRPALGYLYLVLLTHPVSKMWFLLLHIKCGCELLENLSKSFWSWLTKLFEQQLPTTQRPVCTKKNSESTSPHYWLLIRTWPMQTRGTKVKYLIP